MERNSARVRQGPQAYDDPIQCPVCGKVFGEWIEVKGKVAISKYCNRCKKVRIIRKNG